MQAGPRPWPGPECPSPARLQAPFTLRSMLPGCHVKGGEGSRANTHAQHLGEAAEMRERAKARKNSLTGHGPSGLGAERSNKEDSSLLGRVEGAHIWAVDPCCPARLGTGTGHGLSHLRMGENLVSVKK